MNDQQLGVMKALTILAVLLTALQLYLLHCILDTLQTQHLPRAKHNITTLEVEGHSFIMVNNVGIVHQPTCKKCTQNVLNIK